MMFGSREPFDYGRCLACGSLAISTIPEDLEQFYPTNYYANTPKQEGQQDWLLRRTVIRAVVARHLFGRNSLLARLGSRLGVRPPRDLAQVRDLITKGGLRSFDDAILDVGSGPTPFRLAILRKLGFRNLIGIEPFIPHDLEFRGVPVRKAYLPEIEGRFRLVMFHHSLEHVPDPLATLREARERVARDGRCLVRTPVADGAMWQRFGPDWVELDAPRHLVVMSRAGLEALARRAGFELLETVWESGDWELIASEQYQRDVAMFEPGSWFAEPPGVSLDDDQIRAYKQAARAMNAAGDAGRAAVWLRPI